MGRVGDGAGAVDPGPGYAAISFVRTVAACSLDGSFEVPMAILVSKILGPRAQTMAGDIREAAAWAEGRTASTQMTTRRRASCRRWVVLCIK